MNLTLPKASYFYATFEFQVCARLAAEDLLTFSQIANSKIIKNGLIAQGYKKPYDSDTAVSKAVKRYALKVKKDIIQILERKLKKGERFSITLDEYTAKNNRRFMDFNVHFAWEDPKCIGMKRVHGSLNAEAAAQMVEEKLKEYGLNIQTDVICNTTDAASLMTAMGDLLPTIQQLCYAHGLHLAVVDVLYKVRLIEQRQRKLVFSA